MSRRRVAEALAAASRAFLAVDAFIDSTLFAAGRRSLGVLQAIDDASDRLHVSGLTRVAVEFACETLTLGLGGLLVMLTLALPAFRETDGDRLARIDLAVTFQDRYGVEVGKRGANRDEAVPFEELPDYFVKALLATEDRRFFSHFGIDVIGTFRALTVDARAAGVVQGGSSISQQLAKNIFLSNERSIERKIKEAYLALWLEFHLTKKEILKLYLDRAYMGAGAFGVEAAAQTYFGKSARDIDLAEAAMLAGLFKAPTKFSPLVNLAAARARANDVLSNLVDAGFMTEGQVYAARRNPATPVDRPPHDSPDWYLDFAYSEVKALAAAGKLGDRPHRDGAHRPRQRATVQNGGDHRKHAAREGAGLPRPSGRRRDRHDRRPRARNGRRARLWRKPVQPGDRRRAAAGFVVQDLRLHDRAVDGEVPPRHADRRLEHLHRRLLRPQLPRRERRNPAALPGARRVAQHCGHPPVGQDRRSLLAAEAELSPGQDRRARTLQDRADRPR